MNPVVPQSKQFSDLEAVLQLLIDENRKLLKHVEAQQAAMRTMDLKAMDAATNLQESARLRISTLDTQRRNLVMQIAKTLRVVGEPKIGQLAELVPHRRVPLLRLRKDLREVLAMLASKNHVAGRVAGAVLGHLNLAVRLFAGAVSQAGLYTRRGVPQVAARIGMMEAVG